MTACCTSVLHVTAVSDAACDVDVTGADVDADADADVGVADAVAAVCDIIYRIPCTCVGIHIRACAVLRR